MVTSRPLQIHMWKTCNGIFAQQLIPKKWQYDELQSYYMVCHLWYFLHDVHLHLVDVGGFLLFFHNKDTFSRGIRCKYSSLVMPHLTPHPSPELLKAPQPEKRSDIQLLQNVYCITDGSCTNTTLLFMRIFDSLILTAFPVSLSTSDLSMPQHFINTALWKSIDPTLRWCG